MPRRNAMRITLDTNAVGKSELLRKAGQVGINLVVTTVTQRELEGSDIAIGTDVGITSEIFLLDESPLDVGVPGSEIDQDALEDVLRVISNGSFPSKGSRDNLSSGQLRQLRDAMIFVAHVRDSRDIFVTDDEKGFISHERRSLLERTYRTKIRTTQEFLGALDDFRSKHS